MLVSTNKLVSGMIFACPRARKRKRGGEEGVGMLSTGNICAFHTAPLGDREGGRERERERHTHGMHKDAKVCACQCERKGVSDVSCSRVERCVRGAACI